MSEFLPEEIRKELIAARAAQRRQRRRMTVRAGGKDFVILRYWDGGFAVGARDAAGLRGLVDLYENGKHLCQALVVTSRETEGERIFEVKISTAASATAPPADFVRERPEPVAFLPRH